MSGLAGSSRPVTLMSAVASPGIAASTFCRVAAEAALLPALPAALATTGSSGSGSSATARTAAPRVGRSAAARMAASSRRGDRVFIGGLQSRGARGGE